MAEARRAADGSRYPGVRVTEEVFDEQSSLSRTRSIFSFECDPLLDRSRREERYFANLRHARPTFRAERRRQSMAARQCYAGGPVPGLGTPLLYLAAIVMLGLCSLIILHTAFGV